MASSRFPAAIAACLVLVGLSAQATEIQDINQEFRQGQLPVALEHANRYLAKNPKDAQARFLKGLILADLGKTNDAITVFTGLTEDYPELPEPYNNLAVLYASQSKYEAARNALEMAIRTHPSYATAHENLGDLYAKMASMAYDKALAIDSKNATAQTKLALIKNMMGNTSSQRPIARTSAPASAAKAPVAAPMEPKAPTEAKASASNPAIEAAVANWARAWAGQDLDAYFAAYAPDFTGDAASRGAWEAQRRARITSPGHIEVQVSDLKVSQQGDSAIATFRQLYRSDRLSSTVTKTLKLAQQNGQWRIVSETSR